MVNLKDISFSYFVSKTRQEVSVLSAFNAEFQAGKVTVILGPSGCGKTTILNLIAGLIQPTKGEIIFPEPVKEKLRKNIPLGRFGRISDIETAAVFLCSDAASFINGAVLVIDGGQSTG